MLTTGIAEPHRGRYRNDSGSPPPGRIGRSFSHARIICYECLALRNQKPTKEAKP
jgi:hypothetical protein